jgi:hypothetical protein
MRPALRVPRARDNWPLVHRATGAGERMCVLLGSEPTGHRERGSHSTYSGLLAAKQNWLTTK